MGRDTAVDDDGPQVGAAGDEPRWLTREQQEAWVALAMVTIWLPSALDAQLQRDAEISHAEYQVLSRLSMEPGRSARMSSVAEVANMTLSHLSRVVSRLEQRGWMRREPDPVDGRYTLALLTAEGWEKVVATAPGHVDAVRRYVFEHLTDVEVGQLRTIGDKIAGALRPGVCAAARLPRE